MYTNYQHHFTNVWVRADLQGRHRQHCLCYNCKAFRPKDRDDNCDIANAVFANCIKFGIVTPVWECPMFVEQDNG